MSILNNTKNNKQQEKTGATIAEKITKSASILAGCIIGTGIFIGSLYLGVSIQECKTHNGFETCSMMKIIETIKGQEQALEHHMNHLQNNAIVKDLRLNFSGDDYYDIPTKYEYRTDENGQLFGYAESKIHEEVKINENDEEEIYYSLPNGGILATDENGNKYGYITIKPHEGEYDRTAISYTWPDRVTQLVYYDDQGNLINTVYKKDTNTEIYPDFEDQTRTYRLTK